MKIENLDYAMNEMFDFIADMPSGLDGFESDFNAAFSELEKIKSDNVVSVVRCKDCVFASEQEEYVLFCENFEKDMLPDDFCSCGERKS